MKKLLSIFTTIILFFFLVNPVEIISSDRSPAAVLWTQNELATHYGQGYNGANVSRVPSPGVLRGINVSQSGFFWGADDFIVPPGKQWTFDSALVYAYQNFMTTTTSTIAAIYIVIFNGQPGLGGTIIWGDSTTNRLTNTRFSNIYRIRSDTLLTNRTRPIMTNRVGLSGLILTPGTYWIAIRVAGSASYQGPWMPLRTPDSTTMVTGNALQFTSTGWNAVFDSNSVGTHYFKGLPFVLYGTESNVSGISGSNGTTPVKYVLEQNYPNPFNPTTNIRYQIVNSKYITIKIFNILGKEVSTLVNGRPVPGAYEVTWNASDFPGGVYFYRLQSEDFSETKKMLLVK